MVFRILYEDRPFAVVVLLALGLGGLVFLGLPKIWKSTPPGFPLGEMRVSLLDYAQAWSLSRAALRAEAAGEEESALMSWRGALANNMADPRLHRGVLTFLRRTSGAQSDRSLFGIRSAVWLIALSRTNLTDLALIGDVMDRYHRPRVALAWMVPVALDQDPALEKARAKCLLSAGRLDAFAERWRVHGETWKGDPVLAMYHDAWLASTDDRTAGLEATVRLKEAIQVDGEPGLTAARLLILVAAAKGQVDDLGRAVEALEARHSATAAQHGYYWKALAVSGRGDEARRLATEYRQIPTDPEMAAMQWRALRDIGMPNEALAMAAKNLERYGSDLEAWRTYFDLLIDSGRWSEAIKAAADARMRASRLEPLYVEALFAEYRAAWGEERETDEARLARELAGVRVTEPDVVVRISSTLRARDRLAEAVQLLKAHEQMFRDWPAYWAEVFSAGLMVKDLDILRHSVGELTRIEPSSLTWANNRAALLLITGEDPPEALRLTLAGLTRNPGSPTLKINHALALLATGRAAEAEKTLQTLVSSKLAKDVLANFHLAMAETHFALGRKPEAVMSADAVDRSRLLAPQLERLDRVTAQARGSAAP